MLLKEKKLFQETFNSKQETDDNGEVGNEEGRTTFSKLGKVFCESLVFCQDNKFWSSANKQCFLRLYDNWQLINLEMLLVPLTGEQRINHYIDLHLKSTPGGADDEYIETRDSVILPNNSANSRTAGTR